MQPRSGGQPFAEYRFDYVVNFAAESHVDRSIENPQLFLITNILGTQNLLDCARRAWVMGKDEQGYPTWRKGVRYHQVSTDEVYGSLGAEGYFTEETRFVRIARTVLRKPVPTW